MFELVKGLLGRVLAGENPIKPFTDLAHQVVETLKPHEQAELKSMLAEARRKSDEAQDDFVKAGRGQ